MTTTITVKTHSWAVEAHDLDATGNPTGISQIVPPNSARDLHIWQGKSLLVIELPPEAPENNGG